MNIDVFKEAQALYGKYQLCEKVLEYLSDSEKVRGLKYKELLSQFAKVYESEFMMFVHDRMTEAGMAFEELPDCNCDKQPEENPETPGEPKEPKFAIGSKVEVTAPVHKGKIGTVKDYDSDDDQYYVSSDSFSMWFPEYYLKAYVEESGGKKFAIGEKVWYRYDEDETLLCTVVGFEENSNRIIIEFKENENEDARVIFHVDPEVLEKYEETEEPTPDEDDKYEMVYGERVIVKSGEYAGKVGTIIDVMVGFTKVLVGLDDVEDAVEFTPDQLAKYTDPEWTEANDGSASGNSYIPLSGGTITSNGNG